MKIFLYLFLLIKLIYAKEKNEKVEAFENFIDMFDKNYEHDEYQYRFQVFSHNYELVESNNLYNSNFKLELNQFADLSTNEFEKDLLLLKTKRDSNKYLNTILLNSENTCSIDNDLLHKSENAPLHFDWQEKNKVTSVKNQGSCGSCWAFSTVSSVESENAIVNNKLVNLSPQELVDCSSDYGNKGCNGGLMEYGFHFIMDKGLCSDKDYPYKGHDETCKKCNEMIKISDCREVPSYNETALKYAVLKKPISVAVDAGSGAFQFYSKGIVNSGCGTRLNHAVLLVGYGEENGQKFWRIKNSWGSNWGEDGYIRLARQDTNEKSAGMCGLTKEASYPIL